MKPYDNSTSPEMAAPVESIKEGTYVKRLNKDGCILAKVYIRGAYNREWKQYSLTDTDNVNREVFVKRGTPLRIGFTY